MGKTLGYGEITVANMTEPFTVMLTNEAQQFATDSNRKVTSAQSYYTDIIVIRGSQERTDYTIGNITSGSGITVSKNSKRVTFSVSAGTTIGADAGVIEIPITLDGQTVKKQFSWSCGKQGPQGVKGDPGTSVKITSKSVTYQTSTSGTTAPTGTWSTTVPTVNNGQYLWTKTTVQYSDGNKTEAYSVSYKGTNGTNGTSVTVSKTEVTYQVSASGTTAPTGTWSTTMPSCDQGQYLWTKTYVKYSDGKDTTSYSVSYKGVDGEKFSFNMLRETNQGNKNWDIAWGKEKNDGNYVTESFTDEDGTNGVKFTCTEKTTGWLFASFKDYKMLETLKPATKYVLSFDIKTNIKNSTIKTSLCTGSATDHFGRNATTQLKGDNTWEHVVWNLTTYDPLPKINKQFIYLSSTAVSYVGETYIKNLKLTEGTVDTPWAPHPEDLEGRGVSETVQYYLVTSQASGVTSSTSGWSTDITTQKLTADKKYLWNCYQTKYSDGTSEPISTPKVIGVYGDKGQKGEDGQDGAGFHWNLLKYSGDLSQMSYGKVGGYIDTQEFVSDASTPSKNALKSTITTVGDGMYIQGKYLKKEAIKRGNIYTVSVWCKCSSAKDIGVMNVEFLDKKVNISMPKLSTEWQQYIITGVANKDVTTTSGGSAISFYYGNKMAVGDIFYISSPKVEEGDKPSPWCTTYEETLAKSLSITPSSQYFKSTDGGKTFAPNAITIKPTIQGEISFGKWQYSIDGGVSFADVVSGQKGLTVSNNVLAVSKDSSLYSDAVTMVTFRAVANDSSFYDTCSIAKIYDVSDIGDGRNLIQKSQLAPIDSTDLNLDDYSKNGTVVFINKSVNSGFSFDKYNNYQSNSKYVLSYYFTKTSGTINSFGGFHNGKRVVYTSFFVDDKVYDTASYAGGSSQIGTILNDGKRHRIVVCYTTPDTIATDTSVNYTFIQPGRGNTNPNFGVKIEELKLEKGSSPTGWSAAPEDLQTAILSTKSEISDVSLKVDNNKQAIEQRVEKTTYQQDLKLVKGDISKANEGLNKWRYEIYPKSLFTSEYQGKSTMDVFAKNTNLTPSQSVLINDTDFGKNWAYGDNYIGYALTFVKFSAAKSVAITFKHDDGAHLYLNGKLIGGDDTCNTGSGESLTLSFIQGWNCLEVVLNEKSGGEYIGLGTTISAISECQLMNCYYGTPVARQSHITNQLVENTTNIKGISTKVSKVTSVIGDNGENFTSFKNEYSDFKQTMNGFKTTVSQTYVTKDDFNGLEIGGRNLLTKDDCNMSKWQNLYPAHCKVTNNDYSNHIDYVPTGGEWEIIYKKISVTKGQKYILSFDYKVNKAYNYLSGQKYGVYLSTSVPTNAAPTNIITDGQYAIENTVISIKRGVITFTAPIDTLYIAINGGCIDDNQTGLSFEFNKWKLEKGNKATDWTPASEDNKINGQNLVSNLPTNWEQGSVQCNTGSIYSGIKTATTTRLRVKDVFSVSGNVTISAGTSTNPSKEDLNFYYVLFDVNKKEISNSSTWQSLTSAKIINCGDAKYMAIILRWGSATTMMNPSDISQICLKIERGTSATPFTLAPEDVNGKIVNVETIANQTANKFEWIVKGGDSSSNFTLTDRVADLVAERINFKGLVTFSGLSTDAKNEIGKVAQSKVDGLEVGGRNLIINSNLSRTLTNVTNDGCSNMTVVSDSVYGHALKFTAVNQRRVFWATSNVWVKDKTYTVSFVAKSSVTGQKIRPSRSTADWGDDITLTTSYARYTTKITSLDTNAGGTLSFSCTNAVGDITITNVKLEVGNKATDWTPAPEDVSQDATNKASQALTDAKNYSSNAVNWVTNNGSSTTSLNSMVKKWTDGAVSDTTQINGGWIKANTITASKIAVGDFTNYADINESNTYGFSVEKTTDGVWFSKDGSKLTRDNYISKMYSCEPGQTFYVEYDISNTIKDSTEYKAAGIMLFGCDGTQTVKWYQRRGAVVGTAAGTVTHMSQQLTMPSGTRFFYVVLQIEGFQPFTGTLKIRNLSVRKAVTGAVIVDGSITADKIATDAIKSRNYDSSGGTQGSFLNLSDGSFTSPNLSWDANGNLIAKNANLSGQITATKGSIGGWSVDNYSIYTTYDSDQNIFGSGISGTKGKYVLWAGETNNAIGANRSSDTPTDASLVIYNNGGLEVRKTMVGNDKKNHLYTTILQSGQINLKMDDNYIGTITATDTISSNSTVTMSHVSMAAKKGYGWSILHTDDSGNLISDIQRDPGDTKIKIRSPITVSSTDITKYNAIETTGDVVVNGKIHANYGPNRIQFNPDNNGSIELYGGMPFIDFHFACSNADYTSRIISQHDWDCLTFTGSILLGGTIYNSSGGHYTWDGKGDAYISCGNYSGGNNIYYYANYHAFYVNNDSGSGMMYINTNGVTSRVGFTKTSDERIKKNFESFDDNIIDAYMNIEPVKYQLKQSSNDNYHFGFKAQHVDKVFSDYGDTYNESFDICTSRPIDPDKAKELYGVDDMTEEYGLRYDELIAPTTYMVQHTYKELESTKNELTKVKQEKADLEARLQAIEAKLGL
jgi:hypothetical protein